MSLQEHLIFDDLGDFKLQVVIRVESSVEATKFVLESDSPHSNDYLFVDACLDIFWKNNKATLYDTSIGLGSFMPYIDRFFFILESLENNEREISDICEAGKVASTLREYVHHILTETPANLSEYNYNRLIDCDICQMTTVLPDEAEIGCYLYTFDSIAYLEIGRLDTSIDSICGCFIVPIEIDYLKKVVAKWREDSKERIEEALKK